LAGEKTLPQLSEKDNKNFEPELFDLHQVENITAKQCALDMKRIKYFFVMLRDASRLYP